MQWLVCYDIADDTRRQRLVSILLDYGQRVQESVFWIVPPPGDEHDIIDRMRQRVRTAIDPTVDSVWFIPVCSACAKRVETIGPSRIPQIPEFFVL